MLNYFPILNNDWKLGSMGLMYDENINPETLKYWVGVQRDSLTSWGEGASLALVGHPPTDGVMIKMSYGVDVLH